MGFVTPDYGTIFWMCVVFGITVWILKRFAWKPILNGLKAREQQIARALASAESAREEMKRLAAHNEAVLQEARAEKENILKEAITLKNKLLSDAKEQAAMESEHLLEMAKHKIEEEKNAAINDIRQQVAELSVEIAEKVLRRELSNPTAQQQLVDSIVKDMNIS
ncbi:MAG: F0F1 ATP synthase subunit B [Bacteroidales bacterium]|jgi:F-type H+-transporting ATPase subunit b|nr:F0F1 ATP synthase subunit B [Bacteroidales bacterium]